MGSLVAELAEKLSSATNNFDIDEGTIYVNTSADTVGIGTTTPASKLDVQGTMQVGVNDTGHDVKFFGATAGKYMEWDESADQLDVTGSFDVTGNSTMVGSLTVGVDDTGHDVKFFGPTSGAYMEWEGDNNDRLVLMGATTKLGINEATPALPLHISHSSDNTTVDGNSSGHSSIMLQNTDGTADGNYTGIWNQDADNDATNAAIIFKNVSHSNSTASMHFLTRASGASAAEKMMINADGRVGIGSNSPGFQLDLQNGGGDGIRVAGFSTGAGNDARLYLARSNNGTLGTQTAVDNSDALGKVIFQGSNGSAFVTGASVTAVARETWSGTQYGSELSFNVTKTGETSETAVLIIDKNGHIGIGTSSPDANGFGAGHGVLAVKSSTGSAKTAMLNIIGDGNDTADTRVASVFFNDASATGAGATLAGIEAYRATTHATDPGAEIRFSTNVSGGNYTQRMVIDEDGHIGIGVSNPSVRLDVFSTDEVAAAFSRSSDASTYVTIRTAETQNHVAGWYHTIGSSAVTGVSSTNSVTGMISKVMNSGGTLQGQLEFHTNDGDSLTEKLRILESGRITFFSTGTNEMGRVYQVSQHTQGISTSATTIMTAGYFLTYGLFCVVCGRNNSATTERFVDTLAVGLNGSIVVLSTSTVRGSPKSRSYSLSGENLQVAMGGAGAYNITVACWDFEH